MDIVKELKSQDLKAYIEKEVGLESKCVGSGTYRFKVCPICSGGDHFNINTNKNLWNTFDNCGGGSIIDFCMIYNNLDKKPAISKLCDEFNINSYGKEAEIMNEVKEIKTIHEKPAKTFESIDLTSIINNYYNTSSKGYDYFIKRLLGDGSYNDDVISNNFDKVISENKIITGNPKEIFKDNLDLVPGLHNIKAYEYIIPVWENGKIVNCILRRNDEKSKENNKTLNLKGLEVKFLNSNYLEQPEDHIFITEGVFDCLSIECLGHNSICLNSVNMANRFIDLVKQNINTCKDTKFILALDNDPQGNKAREKIHNELSKLNIKSFFLTVNSSYKDINDYYLNDLEGLKDSIKDSISTQFKGIDENIFYNTIDNYIKYEKLNTGFETLDKKLNGVLPGLYCIGADTGLGKTTYVLQIADYMASQSKKVLFYSLEMSKFEMYCKSLSRIAYEKFNEKISTRDIMFNKDNEITHSCLNEYKTFSKNIEIIESDFNLNIENISNSIQEQINRVNEKPIIFIDYLQVIQPKDFKMTDKASMDYNIKALKRLSRKYFVPIFLISSLNRQSYNSDLDNTAFKESGSIEYTADVMLGLQGKIVDELKEYPSNSKNDTVKRKEIWNLYKSDTKTTGIVKTKLKCLKNRFGQKDFDIEFDFYPKCNCFKENEENVILF